MDRTASLDHPRVVVSRDGRYWRSVVATGLSLAMIVFGLSLVTFAAIANTAWLDRHVLPQMFLSREQLLLWLSVERLSAVALGAIIIWPLRKWVVRQLRRGHGRALALRLALVSGAITLSAQASEWMLGSSSWHHIDHWAATEEPLREADARLGWKNKPGRSGFEIFNDKRIAYYFDVGGRRVAGRSAQIDARRPSVLFIGESIMMGFRLNWSETVAGRLEAATGLQSVNLAVNGYATDQTFMRLSQDLPHFSQPVAVIALFSPTLLERNLGKDRPYLDDELRWHAGHAEWRLKKVFRNIFLYHSQSEIDDAIAQTRMVLRATVQAALARNAIALILVPGFAPEQPGEREIRRRVLDDAGLPYVYVPLDPRWRFPHDGHPDAAANRAMAEMLLEVLAKRGLARIGSAPRSGG